MNMKAMLDRATATMLFFFASTCLAQGMGEAEHAPSPMVSGVWVVVFLLLFVGICAWFVVALWRSERKHQETKKEDEGQENVGS